MDEEGGNVGTKVAGGFNICSFLISILFNLAFGIYALVLYGALSPKNPNDINGASGTCMASTTLNLLLALGIIQLCLLIFNVLSVVLESVKLCFEKATSIINIFNSCQSIIASVMGMALFALTIAMSVFVWRDQCSAINNDVSNGYYFGFMQTFLIIYWVVPFGLGCILICSVFAMTICCSTAVAIAGAAAQ